MTSSKINKSAKKTIIIVVAILGVIIVGALITLSCLVCNAIINSDIFIESLIGLFSVAATVSLGLVAYWQTRGANKISELLSQRTMISSIVLLKDVDIACSKHNSAKIIEFAKKNETEGAICSAVSVEQITRHNIEEAYLKFCFYFKNDNAPIENIFINDIYFNKSFISDEAKKDKAIKFNIINEDNRVPFSYNPTTENYSLQIYLNIDEAFFNKTFIKSVNDSNLFVLDIDLMTESCYGVKENVSFSINFISIEDLTDIISNKKSKTINLTNVLIHKGEINYG